MKATVVSHQAVTLQMMNNERRLAKPIYTHLPIEENDSICRKPNKKMALIIQQVMTR
jgi:hypothetical protein